MAAAAENDSFPSAEKARARVQTMQNQMLGGQKARKEKAKEKEKVS